MNPGVFGNASWGLLLLFVGGSISGEPGEIFYSQGGVNALFEISPLVTHDPVNNPPTAAYDLNR